MNHDQTEFNFDEEEKQTADETVQPKVKQKEEEAVETPSVPEKPNPIRAPKPKDEDDDFAAGAWGELGYRKK